MFFTTIVAYEIHVMDWILSNWTEITAAVVAAGTAASVIVKLTPNTKDDAVLAKVLKVLSLFGIKLVK